VQEDPKLPSAGDLLDDKEDGDARSRAAFRVLYNEKSDDEDEKLSNKDETVNEKKEKDSIIIGAASEDEAAGTQEAQDSHGEDGSRNVLEGRGDGTGWVSEEIRNILSLQKESRENTKALLRLAVASHANRNPASSEKKIERQGERGLSQTLGEDESAIIDWSRVRAVHVASKTRVLAQEEREGGWDGEESLEISVALEEPRNKSPTKTIKGADGGEYEVDLDVDSQGTEGTEEDGEGAIRTEKPGVIKPQEEKDKQKEKEKERERKEYERSKSGSSLSRATKKIATPVGLSEENGGRVTLLRLWLSFVEAVLEKKEKDGESCTQTPRSFKEDTTTKSVTATPSDAVITPRTSLRVKPPTDEVVASLVGSVTGMCSGVQGVTEQSCAALAELHATSTSPDELEQVR
tara:strand:+ start:1288 stop:2505 length:1218 start_codon:yes stop_codon:yes gene_type:complete